jgi:hypothetical protein
LHVPGGQATIAAELSVDTRLFLAPAALAGVCEIVNAAAVTARKIKVRILPSRRVEFAVRARGSAVSRTVARRYRIAAQIAMVVQI